VFVYFIKAGKNNNKFNFQTLDLNIVVKYKMRIVILYTCLKLLLCSQVHAQGILSPVGAKHWATGGTTVIDESVFSGINNPALLTHLTGKGAGLNSEQRFAMRELQTASVAGYSQLKYFSAAAHIVHFGYALFNQQRMGFSMARQISAQFSIGVSAEYLATNIAEYGNSGLLIPSLGVVYKANKVLTAGFYIFNPAQQKYSNALVDPVPTFARIGLCYALSSKVTTMAECEQMLDQRFVIRGGIRYYPHDKIWVSVGAASQPALYTMGTGILLNQFRIDMAMVVHQITGITPQLSISYPFEGDKK
jgi:hypothetical protein